MDKEFLKKQMMKLETNYGKEKFHISKDIFDLWLEMFADCDEKGMRLAVDNYIKENVYAPNIAGIMNCYRELEAERADLTETIRNQYSIICSIWGEKYESETLKEIQKYILKFPKEKRKDKMVELTHEAVSFRHDCDACGRKKIPTIKEYIQGAK